MTERRGRSGVSQEPQDVSGTKTAWVAAGVISIGLGAVGAMAWILSAARSELEQASPVPIAAPGLRVSPIEHSRIERAAPGLELQARARRRLDEWGWVKPGEIARIPVAEAAEWLLMDTEHARGSSPAKTQAPTGSQP